MNLTKNGRATTGQGGTPPVDSQEGPSNGFDEDGEAVARTGKEASSRRRAKDVAARIGEVFAGKEVR